MKEALPRIADRGRTSFRQSAGGFTKLLSEASQLVTIDCDDRRCFVEGLPSGQGDIQCKWRFEFSNDDAGLIGARIRPHNNKELLHRQNHPHERSPYRWEELPDPVGDDP